MDRHAFGEQTLPEWRRAVLKVGSSLLAADDGGLSDRYAAGLAQFVSRCRAQGREVVIVSSGAVAAGRGVLKTEAAGLNQRQALAALGQAPMIALWQRLSEVPVAQVLLSHDDVRNRRRYLNARATLARVAAARVLPVVNENDTVAVDELKLGDNDNLAAVVAALVDADLLLIATDIAGPLQRPSDQRSDGTAGAAGRGDHAGDLPAWPETKPADLEPAACAPNWKRPARPPRPASAPRCSAAATPPRLRRSRDGKLHGTYVEPHGDRLLARKQWLRNAPTGLHGVRVDAGAAQALGSRGASLLPGGIVAVEGEFGRGDLIEVRLSGDAGSRVIARGLVQYNSADLQRIAGRHSGEIETILGYRYGEAVIHRDDLVVLPREGVA